MRGKRDTVGVRQGRDTTAFTDSTSAPDIGLDQVDRVVPVPDAKRDATSLVLPASEVLKREVYTKTMKGQTMVRKLVLWKTNKEEASDNHPGFVLHLTDYSPNRKNALAFPNSQS